MKMASGRRRRLSFLLHALLAALALLWMIPVFWLLLSSFRAEPGAYTPYLWPKGFTLDNYARLFTDTRLFNFPRWFGNTLLVAVCSCLITTVLTLMVAYVYSRLRFKSRRALMNASLVLGMFPGFMSMIAIYHFLKGLRSGATGCGLRRPGALGRAPCSGNCGRSGSCPVSYTHLLLSSTHWMGPSDSASGNGTKGMSPLSNVTVVASGDTLSVMRSEGK